MKLFVLSPMKNTYFIIAVGELGPGNCSVFKLFFTLYSFVFSSFLEQYEQERWAAWDGTTTKVLE